MKGKFLGLILVVLLFAGVGIYMFYQAEQTKKVDAIAAVQVTETRENFEDFLNKFLNDISKEAHNYKESRMVLVSLVKPENLKNSAYIQENEALAAETIASLQTQMDQIMALFETADQRVSTLAQSFDEAEKAEILKRWKIQRDERSAQFLTYFQSEQDILAAYKELLQFYAQKRGAMSVDVANNKIMFTNPEDQIAADAISARILELTKKQHDVLKAQ